MTRTPDRELRVWRRLAAWLPPVPRALGVANHGFRPVYLRKVRDVVRAPVWGVELDLDPHEHVDALLLFAPHLVDRVERRFLEGHLREGASFLDAGAYKGAYALWAKGRVGAGRVVAVEAHPAAAAAIREAAARSGRDVDVVEAALGDGAFLDAGPVGNAGGRRLGDVGTPVRSTSVAALLDARGLRRFDVVKLDLEGQDARVVDEILALPPERWPRAWVVELPRREERSGDLRDRLTAAGFRVRRASRLNVVADRPSP